MATSTWELHLGHVNSAEMQFLLGYFDLIRQNHPDEIDHLVDEYGLHVMVGSLQILVMVLGALDHRHTPESLSVEVHDDLQSTPKVPLIMKAELGWDDTESDESITLGTR